MRKRRDERPINKPPTKRQLQVLALVYWWGAMGESVTFRKIGAYLGFAPSSTMAVGDQLRALRRRGLVTWEPTKAQTLRATEAGKALVCTVRCGEVTDKKMLRALKKLPNMAPGVVDKVLSGKRRRT